MKVEEAWAWRGIAKTRLLFNPDEALNDAKEMERLLENFHDQHATAYGDWLYAELHLALGDHATAMRYFQSLEKYNKKANDRYLNICTNLGIAEVFKRKGDFKTAKEKLTRAENESRNLGVFKKEFCAKLGLLEAARLQSVTTVSSVEYDNLILAFHNLRIPWGQVHSLLGKALMFQQAGDRRGSRMALDQAKALSITYKFHTELAFISSMESKPWGKFHHTLNPP
jgi:ATP/maltotriose-dependent transcriptional regulator MalT